MTKLRYPSIAEILRRRGFLNYEADRIVMDELIVPPSTKWYRENRLKNHATTENTSDRSPATTQKTGCSPPCFILLDQAGYRLTSEGELR